VPSVSTGKLLIEVKILRKKIRLIFEHETFDIAPTTYADFYLYPGKILTSLEFSNLKSTAERLKFENAAYRLLAKANYSQYDLSQRLYKRGATKTMVESIITQLKKQHLIDDKKFIKERIQLGHHRNEGHYKILADLKNKGISQKLLDAIFIDEQLEIDKAINHLDRLNNRYRRKSFFARKQATIKNLLEHGFKHNIIIQAMNNYQLDQSYNEIDNLKQEYQTALRKYQSRYKGRTLTEHLYKYLAQKGYRYDDIKNIVKGEKQDEMD
jgi:regulatory protein